MCLRKQRQQVKLCYHANGIQTQFIETAVEIILILLKMIGGVTPSFSIQLLNLVATYSIPEKTATIMLTADAHQLRPLMHRFRAYGIPTQDIVTGAQTIPT
jgi:hypothetical protein